MKVESIPTKVRKLLQSGIVISDATQCVLELVYNALDAEATSIAVRVNLKTFYVQVVDNGLGISKEDLSSVGKRHMTSKCSSIQQLESVMQTFGYRGSALASIVSVCKSVEIQSRQPSADDTYTKLMTCENSEVRKSKTRRPVHGTTVSVTGLLAALPVRRKRVKEVFDLDEIQFQLQALAAIHHQVSFSLRNDQSGKVILQTRRYEESQQTLCELFGLAPNRILIPLQGVERSVHVSGVVSRQLHTDTSIQMVYVNRRIIHKSKVHKLIINTIQNYGDVWGKDCDQSDEFMDVDGYIFVVKIQCPYLSVELMRSGRKTSVEFSNAEEVLTCVCHAVKRALKQSKSQDHTATSLIQANMVTSSSCVIEQQPSCFGPSQLKNVVKGQCASREITKCDDVSLERKVVATKGKPEKMRKVLGKRASYEKKIAEKQEECADCSVFSTEQKCIKFNKGSICETLKRATDEIHIEEKKYQNENIAPSRVCQKPKINSELNVVKRREQCDRPECIEQYCGTFFNQSNVEGTALAENAAIYELHDVSQFSFYDFLAWLQVKATTDSSAMALFSEFTGQKSKANAPNNAPLVPLKDIRKEKFAMRSQVMLKRLEEARQVKKSQGDVSRAGTVNISTHVLRERTSYYTPRHLPHVSFQDFLAWLRCKAKQDKIAQHMLNEFCAFKMPRNARSLTSLCDVRREKLAVRSDQLVTRIRQLANIHIPLVRCKTRTPPPNYSFEAKLSNVVTYDQVLQKQKKRVISPSKEPQKRKKTEDNVKECCSWKSHYREITSRTHEPITEDCVPNREHYNSKNKTIMLSDDPLSSRSAKCESAQCSASPILQPVVTPQAPQHWENPRPEVVANPVLTKDKEIQAYPLMTCVATQVGDFCIVYRDMSIQTENSQKYYKDQEIQANEEELNKTSIDSVSLERCLQKIVFPDQPKSEVENIPFDIGQEEEPLSNESLKTPTLSAIVGSGPAILMEQLQDTAPVTTWQQKQDESGCTFFVHSSSGFTTFEPPASSTKHSFSLYNSKQSQCNAVPTLQQSGLEELQAAVEISCPGICISEEEDRNFGKKLQETLGEVPILSAKLSKQAAIVHGLLTSSAFTCDDLQHAAVVGQLDQKLIVLLVKKRGADGAQTICLLDQHAVHERIQLETLLEKYRRNGKCESKIVPPFALPVPVTSVKMVETCEPQFTALGLLMSPHGTDRLLVTAVPSCFLRRPHSEGLLPLVTDLIDEVIEHASTTRGAALSLPNTIVRAIASQACRTAIKFNQQLSSVQMVSLLTQLRNCQLPFQCAHGRPSLAPIFQLDQPPLVAEPVKLNFKRFRKNN